MGRFKHWMIGAAVFFILFTVIGFFVLPPILKTYLIDTLSRKLNRQVSIADIGLNPYTLTLTLRGIGIKEPKSEEDFVSLDKLAVNLDIRTVFRRAPVIESFIIRKPYVHLVRNWDNTYNFSDLLALMKEDPKDRKKNAIGGFKRLDAVMQSIEPLESKFHIARIAIDSPDLNVRRDKSGAINLLALAPPPKENAKPAGPEPQAGEKPLPKVHLDDFDLKGGRILYRDEVPKRPISSEIRDLKIKWEKISTIRDSQGTLSAAMDRNRGMGSISVSGPVGLNLAAAKLDVDLKRVRIRPFQGHFTKYLSINCTEGDLSARGAISAKQGPEKDKGMTVQYDGNLVLANVATVDKVNGDDFLKFMSLYASGMSAGCNPLFVRIRDLAATDFFIRIIVNADRTLNLRNVARAEAAGQAGSADGMPAVPKNTDAAKPEEKKEYAGDTPAKNIEINRISIQNGAITFDDRQIKPNYTSTPARS